MLLFTRLTEYPYGLLSEQQAPSQRLKKQLEERGGHPSGHANYCELDPATAEVSPPAPSSHTPALCPSTSRRHLPTAADTSCVLACIANWACSPLPSSPETCFPPVNPKRVHRPQQDAAGKSSGSRTEPNLDRGLHPAPPPPDIPKTPSQAQSRSLPSSPLPEEPNPRGCVPGQGTGRDGTGRPGHAKPRGGRKPDLESKRLPSGKEPR